MRRQKVRIAVEIAILALIEVIRLGDVVSEGSDVKDDEEEGVFFDAEEDHFEDSQQGDLTIIQVRVIWKPLRKPIMKKQLSWKCCMQFWQSTEWTHLDRLEVGKSRYHCGFRGADCCHFGREDDCHVG